MRNNWRKEENYKMWKQFMASTIIGIPSAYEALPEAVKNIYSYQTWCRLAKWSE